MCWFMERHLLNWTQDTFVGSPLVAEGQVGERYAKMTQMMLRSLVKIL